MVKPANNNNNGDSATSESKTISKGEYFFLFFFNSKITKPFQKKKKNVKCNYECRWATNNDLRRKKWKHKLKYFLDIQGERNNETCSTPPPPKPVILSGIFYYRN